MLSAMRRDRSATLSSYGSHRPLRVSGGSTRKRRAGAMPAMARGAQRIHVCGGGPSSGADTAGPEGSAGSARSGTGEGGDVESGALESGMALGASKVAGHYFQ